MTHEEEVQAWNNITQKIRENPWIILMLIFALVYPISEICQQLLIGPRWLRWHAGAIGFAPGSAWILSSFFSISIIRCLIPSFLFQVLWEFGQYPVGHFDPYDMLLGSIGTAVILLLAYNYKTKTFSSLAINQLV